MSRRNKTLLYQLLYQLLYLFSPREHSKLVRDTDSDKVMKYLVTLLQGGNKLVTLVSLICTINEFKLLQREFELIDSHWVGSLSRTREKMPLQPGQVRSRTYLVALPDGELEYRSTLLYLINLT
jgi:hypothetical protein